MTLGVVGAVIAFACGLTALRLNQNADAKDIVELKARTAVLESAVVSLDKNLSLMAKDLHDMNERGKKNSD